MTANIALSDDAAVEGGDLLGLYAGAVRAIRSRTISPISPLFPPAQPLHLPLISPRSLISRAAGEATVHRSSLLHAVTRVQRGSRYSLIMFFGPDPEAQTVTPAEAQAELQAGAAGEAGTEAAGEPEPEEAGTCQAD